MPEDKVVNITQADVDQVLRDPLVNAQIRITALVRELRAAYARIGELEGALSALPPGYENV